MNLWKKWCKKVEEHNKPLEESWVLHDECWHPSNIFIAPLSGIAMFILLYSFGKSIPICMISALIVIVVCGIFQFINWTSYK